MEQIDRDNRRDVLHHESKRYLSLCLLYMANYQNKNKYTCTFADGISNRQVPKITH